MGHSTAQPAPPVPAYSDYPEGYPGSFVAFHDAYGWIYDAMVEHARDLKGRGFNNVGVRYLFEHLRYSRIFQVNAPKRERSAYEFGLNNNFSTWYGRLIEAREKDLRGFFRLRATGGEMRDRDTGQTALEFD